MTNLNTLFKPQSVAIVGISKSPEKLGNVIFQNLIASGFKGTIYPVNPKYDSFSELKCYKDITEIQENIDVVCIVVPRNFVKDVVIKSVEKQVKNIIIISAGFGETGKEGKDLEDEINIIVKNSNTRVLGPNCLGIMSRNCNISFASSSPNNGNISFLSQSGALCTAFLDMAITDGLGFANFISIGNKVDITENDLLKHALEDEETTVISAYLEEIDDDINMLKIYSTSKNAKPFVLFKPGKSNQAKKAMLSHTGSIADNERIYETAMNQYGITMASSITSMYNLIKGFSWSKEVKGKRVAVITNAGGPGIIATDSIVQNSLTLATLSPFSQSKLKTTLPTNGNQKNPIDVLGDATSDRYRQALEIVIADENVDVIFVLLTPQYVTQVEQTAQVIVDISNITQKPIVPIFLGNSSFTKSTEIFKTAKIPLYHEIDQAVEVISKMYNFFTFKENRKESIYLTTDLSKKGIFSEIIKSSLTDEAKALPDHIIADIINEVEISLPPQMFCQTIEEALEFAKVNFPVVLKAPNSQIAHKTDMKALYTNIKDEGELNEAFSKLHAEIKEKLNIVPQNLLIQKQMKFKEELMLGIKRDGKSDVYEVGKGFGHLLLFGKGGIYTQVYDDFAFSLIPFNHEQLMDMISKTKIAQILVGTRGQESLAVSKLVETIQKLQRLVLMYPEIESMDINPLFIDELEVCAVDVKINVSK